jgi:MFS family permease
MWLVFWFWLLIFIVAACLVLLIPALRGREIYNHYRDSRAVSCPETHQQVAVSFDARHAAITGFFKKPDLRLAKCTRWSMNVHCEQECIPEASRIGPYTEGEIERPKAKKIYHVPVLIAAFVSWLIGAIWHSQFVFRTRWMEAVGLRRPELRQIVKWWTPHLLTVAACFLFAYGVAWLLVWSKRRGVWTGMMASILLWFTVTLVSLLAAGLTGISGDLLRLEVGYTLLASVAVGAIVGGLSGRLLVEPH